MLGGLGELATRYEHNDGMGVKCIRRKCLEQIPHEFLGNVANEQLVGKRAKKISMHI